MFSRILSFLPGLGLVALIGGATLYFTAERPRHEQIPIHGEVPAFELTATNGQPFSLSDLQGKVWIASLFFSSCPSICPAIFSELAQIKERFPPIELVSITVDPERDTPTMLAQFARRLGIERPDWHLLTGPLESIRTLARHGLKLADAGEPQLHSTRLVLVDGNRQIRGYYLTKDEESLAKLSKDLAQLLSSSNP